jgi:hypothetical protein
MSDGDRLHSERLVECIERILPLHQWSFRPSANFLGSPYKAALGKVTGCPVVIYDAEWCRMRFAVQHDRHEDLVWIYYGRSHAPNDEWTLIWNGVECSCWHHYGNLGLLFSFLDGLTPQQAFQANLAHKYGVRNWTLHPLTKAHHDVIADPANEFRSAQFFFEQHLKFHASIWLYYGLRFFELFDLRHPDLWAKYTTFLKQVYEMKETKYESDVFQYNIC